MINIQIYRDRAGEYRWRMVDGNHRIVADGAEGYISPQGVERAVMNVLTDTKQITRVGLTPVKPRVVAVRKRKSR